METSKLSIKGQITIPKYIRSLLNVKPGERVAFIEENSEIIIRKVFVQAYPADIRKEAIERS
ncbi:AbrB/MazE/SpoVT family DNA-binding domain-containing protein [Priestia megaterium]